MTGCVVYMEEIVNLLTDSWIPVSYADGTQGLATVTEVFTLESIRDTAAVREEFNVSLKLFLSALMAWVYTTTRDPDADPEECWLKLYHTGFDPAVLKACLERARPAFELGNAYPAFMQYACGEGALKKKEYAPVGRLLFGYPAQSTVDKNSDLFVHDGSIDCLCESCAAQALIHQQRFAGFGGRSKMKSLTGSSGMVVIISHFKKGIPLWKNLWLNVLPGSRAQEDPAVTFRWMKPLPAGKVDYSDVRPEDVAALWILPRLIKMPVEDSEGECSLCGRHVKRRVRSYVNPAYLFPKPRLQLPYAAYQKKKQNTLEPLDVEVPYSSYAWFSSLCANGGKFVSPRMLRGLFSNLAFDLESSGHRHQFKVQCAGYIHGIAAANRYYPDLWFSRTETLDALSDENMRGTLFYVNDAAVSFLLKGSRVLFFFLSCIARPNRRSGVTQSNYKLQFTECSRMYELFDSAYRALMQESSRLLAEDVTREQARAGINAQLKAFYAGVKRRLILEYQSSCSELNASDFGDYFRNYQDFKTSLENLKTPEVEEIA